jgi:hypothetical protein
MKAVELLVKLKQAGVILSIRSDGKLAYLGPAESIGPDVIEEIKAVRDELLAVVELFEERAAILEFDGGLDRGEAEARALMELRSPRVLNKRGGGIPVDAVYVGRPSKWGNPFKIENFTSRADCVAAYREWILAKPELIEQARRELRGKDLVCWCAPLACHGDVLLEIANGDRDSKGTPGER